MGSCNGGKIRITQFQLDCTSVQIAFAQTSSYHLRKPHQGAFQLGYVCRVLAECVLVADGLWVCRFANLVFEPAASIHTLRFARQRQSPFAEAFFQKCGSESL